MGAVTRPLAIAAALVLVGAAFAVARTEPQEDLVFAPFGVRVAEGERGEGRGLRAAVDGAALADVVVLDRWTGTTTGVWLLVDARMESTENPTLAYATVQVGERVWPTSLRPGIYAMQSASLDPGLPVAGTFVFELPEEVLDEAEARRATLRLSTKSDTRLITVVEVELDLTGLDRAAEVELERRELTRW
ncbi:MAG: hypothetical protein BGO94_11190 [Micrococcales bacterium 72-143]|nr:MAG: hypothetical protein BGO94_11190 [Micrococcales bacterium 72-143]